MNAMTEEWLMSTRNAERLGTIVVAGMAVMVGLWVLHWAGVW